MADKRFSKISSIIQDAKKGKMFILVDDKNRENEGDLIIPASKCTAKTINFMAKHGRGLICLALSKKQIDILTSHSNDENYGNNGGLLSGASPQVPCVYPKGALSSKSLVKIKVQEKSKNVKHVKNYYEHVKDAR